MQYVYGPVPSRRLGISLGVSPIPKKMCNYSCIYCQLGRTNHLCNTRCLFFDIAAIMQEVDFFLQQSIPFDVITIVGEGEPTLYSELGLLIQEIKQRTNKPIAVITNGALLHDKNVQASLLFADIVLPTLDGYDTKSFHQINRPHPSLSYEKVIGGLREFSAIYQGQLWIEIMLLNGLNDDDASLLQYIRILKTINYDRLYLNTPIRPPAEPHVQQISQKRMIRAVEMLGGISIDLLQSKGFHSEIKDDMEAILSIIKRHPMNQYEIQSFLKTRQHQGHIAFLKKLAENTKVKIIDYKGYTTYRLR